MVKAKDLAASYCQEKAAVGIRVVLLTRLTEMVELREQALNWDDIEGVHDMRVASRRLRSALRDFQPYLQNPVPQNRLKGIARALGAVRDEDVALEALAALRQKVSEDLAGGIARLMSEREQRRDGARRALTEEIREDNLSAWREKLTARIEQAARPGATKRGNGGPRNFAAMGSEIVRSRFRELREDANSLYRPWEIEPLHRLRITAKRLRYAMELLAPCAGAGFDFFASEVADLQGSLGKLHDCDVWIADLSARLSQKSLRRPERAGNFGDELPEEVFRSSVHLLSHFTKNRAKYFQSALERWTEWETTDFAGRLESSLPE